MLFAVLFKSISTKEKVLLLKYFYKGRDGQYAVSIRPALVIVKSFEKSYLEAWPKKIGINVRTERMFILWRVKYYYV